MNHEELVELLQEGKIGYLRFVLEGENGQDYLEWCRAHGTDPSDESRGLWHLELTRRPSAPARRP